MTDRRKLVSVRFGVLMLTLALSVAPNAALADIGRLFFTPEERATFEKMRRMHAAGPVATLPEVPSVIEEDFSTELEPMKPTITIDGFVRRSNGRTTLWVNRENSYDGNLSASQIDAQTTHMHGEKIHLTPLGENIRVRLKSGQSYDPNTTTVTDVYERPPQSDEMLER